MPIKLFDRESNASQNLWNGEFANNYDNRFTHTLLGQLLRQAIWKHLDGYFLPGMHILDLGCGTGEDTLHLAQRAITITALDSSAYMIGQARLKTASFRENSSVDLKIHDIRALGEWPPVKAFDGAFSNFGAINCVRDLKALSFNLSRLLKQDSKVILTVMGPMCLWETAAYLIKGNIRQALRRFLKNTSIYYPSPNKIKKEFSAHFSFKKFFGVGFLLPPTDFIPIVDQHPILFQHISHIEEKISNWPMVPWLSDHYLIILEKK
jgi:ubiquinone/menaquinone biosynthesis C-methylase UbiE